MKILWLCNIVIPELSDEFSVPANYSGGWISGLLKVLLENTNFDISIMVPVPDIPNVILGKVGKLTYFGFRQERRTDHYSNRIENCFSKVLREARPDIIHIFGTEYPHTLAMMRAAERCHIKNRVIINIQGLVSICAIHYGANLPQRVIRSYSLRDFIKRGNIRSGAENFKKRGRYEQEALKKAEHVIGRTDWDEACVRQINDKTDYRVCNENLRDEFYKHKWRLEGCEKHSIFFSQNNYPIKGFHFMLQAMPEILKRYPDARLYSVGNNILSSRLKDSMKQTYYSKYLKQLIISNHLQEKVTFLGGLNEKQMCKQFLKAHVFVMASSVENSPNSLGEAMLLGVPAICSDVGGVKNMLVHGEEGFVFQHDAPYMISYYVCKIFDHHQLAKKFSENSRKHALITHDRAQNTDTLLNIYREIY